MSVSIISCPGCKSLILSDTIQCPTCDHILNKKLAKFGAAELPAVARAAEDEVACPDCGEMVRSGLVRCWRCGGFLRQEIAETYQKMLDGPQKVTLSKVPQSDATPAPPPATGGDDDDFVLADGLDFTTEEEMRRLQAETEARRKQEAAQSAKGGDESETIPLKMSESTAAAGKESAPKATDSSKGPDSGGGPAGTESRPAAAKAAANADADRAAGAPAPAPVSTGDPLLDIALQEQVEAEGRRRERRKQKSQKGRTALAGFVFVFCPNGHRIQVEERYRGMTGRCPRCKSAFLVPALDWAAAQNAGKEGEEEAAKESRYKTWAVDAHLHHLDPTKLKLKPGSMEKDFQDVDLGFAADGMMVVTHGKQNAGLFSGEKNKKKIEELRAAVQEHLRTEQEILDLPAAGYRVYAPDTLQKLTVVQPAAYAHESMFAGVPVFGNGRVAVRLPVTEQDTDPRDILFVSFYLSEFRAFAKQMADLYGIKELGHMEGVPLEDKSSNHKCHYSDRMFKSIDVSDFHKADPAIELEIVGRTCQACSLTVSEESRKKEKLGGANGKGIAKAKCPKCTQKFGDKTLYNVKTEDAPEEGLTETGGLSS